MKLGMDILAPEQRSRLMSRIRGKDTRPELRVRQVTYALGFRFRLHRRDLPGSPDLVFASRRKAIFVHGCYWHRHAGCRYAYSPKSNAEFWQAKFAANVARDQIATNALRELGWQVLVIWECETRNAEALQSRLADFLNNNMARSTARDN